MGFGVWDLGFGISGFGFLILFFLFTLVTGPRRSLDLKLIDTRVYEPRIRAHLGTTACFCEVRVSGLATLRRERSFCERSTLKNENIIEKNLSTR